MESLTKDYKSIKRTLNYCLPMIWMDTFFKTLSTKKKIRIKDLSVSIAENIKEKGISSNDIDIISEALVRAIVGGIEIKILGKKTTINKDKYYFAIDIPDDDDD